MDAFNRQRRACVVALARHRQTGEHVIDQARRDLGLPRPPVVRPRPAALLAVVGPPPLPDES